MSAREQVFSAIRRGLGVTGDEAPRRKIVADRLADHPTGVVPSRGKLEGDERIGLFLRMIERAAGTAMRLAGPDELPGAVLDYLKRAGLPPALRRGEDAYLAGVPWNRTPDLVITIGPSDGHDLVAISHAVAGIAETGTLMLTSGSENPTTLNFLPDHHLVVVEADTVVGDLEAAFARLREREGAEHGMPRSVDLITGPSRSADIEQTLILGAHGPRRLHVIVIGDPRKLRASPAARKRRAKAAAAAAETSPPVAR
ncbi:LutC/YkgG family protein [Rhodovulum sp. PH10]|uniref:LutC/YkgG family protein n=1 Tax=Rhodovulum sp. PH10 TaxID=1187851 RepID=UPI000A02A868|nr:lactate utilization protein [Rhodovulum sp. PH10]